MNMRETPFFSIIIPAYNIENYIKIAVDSVLSQSFADYEILLINDGSTDQTWSICQDLAKTEDKIFAYDRPHGGIGKTRNYGMSIAKGKYLVFVDGDDVVLGESLQEYYDTIMSFASTENREAPKVILGGLQSKYKSGTYKNIATKEVKYLVPAEYIKIATSKDLSFYCPPQYIVLRKWIEGKEFLFPVDVVHEDFSWSLKLITSVDKILSIPIPFYEINRLREDSTTRVLKLQNLKDVLTQCKELLDDPKFAMDIPKASLALLKERMLASCFSAVNRYIDSKTIELKEIKGVIKPYMAMLGETTNPPYKVFCRVSTMLGLNISLCLFRIKNRVGIGRYKGLEVRNKNG